MTGRFSFAAGRSGVPPRLLAASSGVAPSPMSRRKKLYEGKAKILYEGPEPGTLV